MSHIMEALLMVLLIHTFEIIDGARKSGESVMKLNVDKDISDCPGFINQVVDTTNLWMIIESTSSSVLSGSIFFANEIGLDYNIKLEVVKLEPVREPFMEVDHDICEHIPDKDMPYTPFIEAMHITECPIAVGNYSISKLTLSLDFAKQFINREFVGKYELKMKIYKKHKTENLDITEEDVSCHVLLVSMIETKE